MSFFFRFMIKRWPICIYIYSIYSFYLSDYFLSFVLFNHWLTDIDDIVIGLAVENKGIVSYGIYVFCTDFPLFWFLDFSFVHFGIPLIDATNENNDNNNDEMLLGMSISRIEIYWPHISIHVFYAIFPHV
jgi:hypothetical protein